MKLEVNSVSKLYGKIKALDNVTFCAKTKRLVFLGQNGSGKTTLLSIIAGIIKPTTGTVRLNDIIPYKQREKVINFISFVFERPKFSVRIKVKDIIKIAKEFQDVDEIVDILGIRGNEDKYITDLSSGQQQMVSLLMGLSRWTDILILDEPFANLDIRRVGNLTNYLNKKKDLDLILSTHVPEEAEMIGDYFVVLDYGKLRWSGSMEDLFNSNIYEVYFIDRLPPDIKVIYRYGRIGLVEIDADRLEDLRKKNIIIGFRKAGVRRIYVETDHSN